MILFVHGECSSCIETGKHIMRIAQVPHQAVGRYDLRKSELFQARPDLYTMMCAVAYNDETRKYVELTPNRKLTRETIAKAVQALV